MKQITRNTFVLIATTILFACNNNDNTASNTQEVINNDIKKEEPVAPPSSTTGFDINKIPVSTANIGDFPFFSLPEDLAFSNKKPIERKYDQLFFPVEGIMTPLEGKVWKTGVRAASGKYNDWSLAYFVKSYDDAINTAGGVKIFEGKVSKEEMDRIKDLATYFGEGGSIDYWNDVVHAYLIRRQNGDDVYIQLAGNTAGGRIQILQKEAFKQTISILKSDEIKQQLEEKGKVVLHINFDTDKATLKPDGTNAVTEILQVLQTTADLKLAINGYTDNTGEKAHNLQLSAARAETVKNELVKAGISAERLSAKGFGQEAPIADNNTEDGKAQNRRVELVKQ